MVWVKESTTSSISSKWANKKINWLGDSITRGWGTTKIYHEYLNERIGFHTSRNYGIDGSTIADGNNPMHSRATSIDLDADLICVFGGTNDWGNSHRVIGDLYTLDASNVKIANTTTTTFYGGLHTLCKNLISRYPSRQIALFTPIHRKQSMSEFHPNNAGHYLEEYVDAIIKIGKWYSIPVLDLWSVSGMQPNEANHLTEYFTSSDGTHPTEKGHKVMADKIEQFMNNVL